MKIPKINYKTYYYGIGAIVLMCAASALVLNKHDNSLKQNYTDRLQNMEYVKNNAPQKYINTLEELNKSESPRIVPEDINDLWSKAAATVRDSLELTTKE